MLIIDSFTGPNGTSNLNGLGESAASTTSARGRRVRFAFTDRQGGASQRPYDTCNLSPHQGESEQVVLANREAVAQQIGLAARQVVYMHQVHGNTVRTITSADLPTQAGVVDQPDCDALVTAEPGVGLAVMVADCVPVLLADPVAGVVAAVHAGRKGVQLGAVTQALEAMMRLGAQRGQVQAVLGPSICGMCYEVPHDMAQELAKIAAAALTQTRQGTSGLDLRKGLAEVLAHAGVQQITSVGGCTNEDDRFYSYRRAQRESSPTGRQAGVVWVGTGE